MANKKEELAHRQYLPGARSGMQIDVMRIGALFEMASKALRSGETHEQVGARMVAFIRGDQLCAKPTESEGAGARTTALFPT